MKKFLIVAFVVIAIFLVAMLGVGMVLDSAYSIDRSVTIQAGPEKVHAWIGHLDKWSDWNPFEKQDPSVVVTLGGKTTGVGASQTWTSNSGNGELTFTKCDPETGIAYDMNFINGEEKFPSKCVMNYTRKGEATIVHWKMEGDMAGMVPTPLAGWMRMLMESMVETSFDQGLADLQKLAEAKG